MQYIIENAYTKKLYAKLKPNMTNLKLIEMSDIATLEPEETESGEREHRFIVDEDDYEAFRAQHYKAREVIVLTENKSGNKPHDTPMNDHVRYILKYQSARNILTLVSRTTFPITFLVFAAKSPLKDKIIEDVSKKYEIDSVISLDFSPNSSFSLFDCLDFTDGKIFEDTIIELITNMPDYLNPPTTDIIIFLNRLKEKKRLLIVSSPLKGALDASLMSLSDTIILVENDKTIKLETHLSHLLKSKHFEVLAYD